MVIAVFRWGNVAASRHPERRQLGTDAGRSRTRDGTARFDPSAAHKIGTPARLNFPE
jgi:hypothetical protein